jgi:hypothetical protein
MAEYLRMLQVRNLPVTSFLILMKIVIYAETIRDPKAGINLYRNAETSAVIQRRFKMSSFKEGKLRLRKLILSIN